MVGCNSYPFFYQRDDEDGGSGGDGDDDEDERLVAYVEMHIITHRNLVSMVYFLSKTIAALA